MNYNTLGFKTAVLSLSILTIMAGAGVAAGIGSVAEAFPDSPETLIKLIMSLPPLLMIISALLTGIWEQHIRSKILIICGLVLFLIGGIGAGFTNSIVHLLFFRAVLGFGTGIILPFSTGLIAACYEGAEKGRMMGFSFASNNLGAMIGNILAGILAAMSWRYMFHIYWIALIPLILVVLFLNKLPENRNNTQNVNKEKLPLRIFRVALFALGVMMVFYLIVTNLALIVNERGIGTSQTAGYLFAVNAVVMLCAGIFLPFLMRLKNFFVPVSLLLVAIGFWGIVKAYTLPFMLLSVVLSGAGIGSLFPCLLNLASEKIPETQRIKAMSITMAFAWFGQFLSPLFFAFVSSLTGMDTPNMFLLISIVFILLAAGLAVFNSREKPAELERV